VDVGVPDKKCDRVGANAEESGMPEGKESGIAEKQIEPERRNGGDQAICEELNLLKADKMGKQSQRDQHDQCRNEQQQF
jgi:hypothetical protein